MAGSAFVGQPTNTEEDYWIARAILLALGMVKLDAHKGVGIILHRPPPGQYHFETRGPGIIAGASVSIAIMIAITGTRLGLRYFKKRLIWGWDDWLIIPGAILAVTWPAIQIAMVKYGGGGKHIYDVTYHEFYILKWLGTVDRMVFIAAVGIIKMSITCFNMRITGLTSKRWMIAHRTFLALLIIYTPAALLSNVLQCHPYSAGFDLVAAGKLPDPPQCFNRQQMIRWAIVFNVIHIGMDFCLLTVPLIVVWKVKMNLRTKIRLFFVFSIGAVSCIASIMRQLTEQKGFPDLTYGYKPLTTWIIVELTFGVAVASLPVLSALLSSSFGRKGSNGKSSSFSAFSGGLRHITTQASDSGDETEQRLQSKDSREGILREDPVELNSQRTGPLSERDRTSGFGLHAKNDVLVSPSPVSTYPVTTYPASVLPNPSSKHSFPV